MTQKYQMTGNSEMLKETVFFANGRIRQYYTAELRAMNAAQSAIGINGSLDHP